MRQGAQGWCTGMTLRDGMQREVGGRVRMGNTCTPMADSWCWRRLLRVPWTARRFNESILKEISPGCSLEGLMLRLKLNKYFGHLMRRVDSLEKTLMLGGIGGRKRRGRQSVRLLDGITE